MTYDQEQPIKWDGLDEAHIGIAEVWDTDGHQRQRLIYNGDLILQLFMTRDGMSFEDAMEFLYLNVAGGYCGPTTPIIMWETPDDFFNGEEE